MRATDTMRFDPPRVQRWRPLVPFALAVAFGTALIFISVSNLRSVKDTAERARQGRAVDVTLQTRQSLSNIGFLRSPEELTAALRNLVHGPVEAVTITDTAGQILLAHPGGRLSAESERLVRLTYSTKRSRSVVMLRAGPHPTYEIVLQLKPKLPTQVRDYFRRVLAKLPPAQRPGWKPTLPPDELYLRTVVTVHDDASAKAIRRARRTHYVSIGVTALLLLFSLMAFVGDRRMLLMHRALQRQQALAEMGEMAAVLAHEIRNPVGIIKGRTQLLLEEKGATAPKTLRTVVDQSQRLERLIDTLLEFARPRPPQPKVLDGELVVEQACDAEAEAAVDKQIAIVSDASEGTLRADPDQLHRVLVNLLGNALQATPEAGRVTIRLRFQGGTAAFTVTDTGPGLPPDLGDEILKPFVTTRQKGSGLGLAVVRRIVEAHGGEVRLGNAPEGGARAEARFPVAGPPAPQRPSEKERSRG